MGILADFATEKAPETQGLLDKDPMNDQNQPDQQIEDSDDGTPVSIRLDQFLQLCGVPTGGQAKLLIQGGEVNVNGELETRRRRKLVPGDVVELDGEVFDVAFEEDA